ncbi:hypothetical protein D3C86_1780630 [compost metagenome]
MSTYSRNQDIHHTRCKGFKIVGIRCLICKQSSGLPFGDLISLSGGTAGINIYKLALIRITYSCNSIQIEVYNIDIDMANDTVTAMYGT